MTFSSSSSTPSLTTAQRPASCSPGLWLALLLFSGLACAQTTPSEPALGVSPKVERIVHEDAGSRVEELKVGGQTRQIEVQTKADMPPYQIMPANAGQVPGNPDGQRTGSAGGAGRASWRLFNF